MSAFDDFDPVEAVKRAAARAGLATQMGFWDDDLRGIAKVFANSALFAVREKRVGRACFRDEPIAALKDVSVRYTGEQLDQDDHNVYMQLWHVARGTNFGAAVEVTAGAMLHGLGWSDSGESYKRLRDSLARMVEGTVWVTDTKPRRTREYAAHLIGSIAGEHLIGAMPGVADLRHTLWVVHLDPDLASIVTGDELTLINWVRHKRMSALAQWLHNHYATRGNALLPYKAATVHELCGSKMANPRSFRLKLKAALEELKTEQFIAHYEIGPRPSYLVTVKRQLDA